MAVLCIGATAFLLRVLVALVMEIVNAAPASHRALLTESQTVHPRTELIAIDTRVLEGRLRQSRLQRSA